jgi:MFS family permease
MTESNVAPPSTAGAVGTDAPVTAADERRDWGKLAIIGLMYMAQTFPAGFASSLVPTIYRKMGMPLQDLWVFSLVAVPYWLRWLWAPIVDAHGSERFGRRKSWFVPCTLLAVCVYASIGFVEIGPATAYLIVGILILKSLVTATQEIAIEAYAIDNLRPSERSVSSGVNVTAEALGQMTALAMLGVVYERYGWRTAAVLAALLMLVFMLPAILRREPPPSAASRAARAAVGRPSLLRFLRRPDSRLIVPLMVLYGIYSGMIFPMIGPFLVDLDLSVAQAGALTGAVLFAATVTGSLASIGVVGRLGPRRALLLCAALAAVAGLPIAAVVLSGSRPPLALLGVLLYLPVAAMAVFYVTVFALRYALASKLQSGTDYSLSGAIGRVGQTLAGGSAGILAGNLGWPTFFVVFAVVGVTASLFGYLVYDRLSTLVAERNLRETGVSEGLQT